MMQEQMRLRFLTHDRERMAEKLSLRRDERWLYLRFCGRPYRVDRVAGMVEWSEDGFSHCHAAGYNEAMAIYDVLCCSKPGCALSGEFCLASGFPGLIQTGHLPGSDRLLAPYRAAFTHKTGQLAATCKRLGGVPEGKGDAAYRLPLFDFLPVRLQFWDADDEFEAQLQLLWDKNTLDYMHYETTWFAALHLFQVLAEMIEQGN